MATVSGPPISDAAETERLLRQLSNGDSEVLEHILENQSDYLRRLVGFRTDTEIRGRADPSDNVQKTQWTVARRQQQEQQAAIAVSRLNPADREILLLRHGEGLSNVAAAEILRIKPEEASKRYGRALLTLHAQLLAAGANSAQPSPPHR